MKKRIFSKKSRWEPGLFIIALVVAAVMAVIIAAPYLLSKTKEAFPVVLPVSSDGLEVLQQAQKNVASGNYDEAMAQIKPLLKGRDPLITPRAVILEADILHYKNQPETALANLTAACDAFKSSPEYPYLQARKARQLEEMSRTAEARDIYESIRDHAPAEIRSLGYLGLARLDQRAGNLVGARDLARRAAEDSPWGTVVWNEAIDMLGPLNVALIFSPQETPESKIYTVEKGDNLNSIGIKLNTTQGLLMEANSITSPEKLSLGQRLKYTPKDFSIIIERSTCSLYLMDNKGIFKRYKTGLGKPGHETTLGKYTIGTKQKDPVWHKPGAGPIAANAPDNELGTRWMPLEPAAEGLPRDLGIHGTIAPETIGSFASKGCARMLNEDVEELYDLVVRATPVEIVETLDPNTQQAPTVASSTPAAAEAVQTAAE
ncbi:MAG TPA: L,D-transpeptidase family protein [Candidatus Hydrogenedentes bacterium]|jgi:lipoprotein-anchoring transpeptidase ErfK/SrfK|nr:L,D-transpeptidase family protein [Candidatus Hydrogenedentota bacterium]HPK23673.1 L,D-transpeptidase family protein [Candidatus Hydrogenedentota bacterium]HQB03761.1 L,D-transpeptidase family protein [Candidatus Hydrogenedentota bacterium]